MGVREEEDEEGASWEVEGREGAGLGVDLPLPFAIEEAEGFRGVEEEVEGEALEREEEGVAEGGDMADGRGRKQERNKG